MEMDANGGCLEFDMIFDHVGPRSEPNLKASVIVPEISKLLGDLC